MTPTQQPSVTQADREQQGWLWLDDMVSSTSDETAADLFYTADQMVDAYIAGAATQAAEIARLRRALIAAGRNAGAGLSDDVTTDFLMGVPEEVRLKIAILSAQPDDQGVARPVAAIEQLRDHQRQLDQDGCFVGVSRQALDEVLQYIGERP